MRPSSLPLLSALALLAASPIMAQDATPSEPAEAPAPPPPQPQTPQTPQTSDDVRRFTLENGCVSSVTRVPSSRSAFGNVICGGADGQPIASAFAQGANGRAHATTPNNLATANAWYLCAHQADGRLRPELRVVTQGDPLQAIPAGIAARDVAQATRRWVDIDCRAARGANGIIMPSPSFGPQQPVEEQPQPSAITMTYDFMPARPTPHLRG